MKMCLLYPSCLSRALLNISSTLELCSLLPPFFFSSLILCLVELLKGLHAFWEGGWCWILSTLTGSRQISTRVFNRILSKLHNPFCVSKSQSTKWEQHDLSHRVFEVWTGTFKRDLCCDLLPLKTELEFSVLVFSFRGFSKQLSYVEKLDFFIFFSLDLGVISDLISKSL